jgi:hypothetical protein
MNKELESVWLLGTGLAMAALVEQVIEKHVAFMF